MPDRIRKGPRSAEVLERGGIYFFHRVRSEARGGETDPDLERYFLVLRPSDSRRFRQIYLGSRHPPSSGRGGEHFWGLVDHVASGPEDARKALGEAHHATWGHGSGRRPAARPAGEGVYAIARHGDHVHLAYSLRTPERPGPLQRDLGIEESASFILSVKHPGYAEHAAPPAYPAHLLELFHGRKYLPADPPGFLDFEKTELLFVAVRRKVERELGIEFQPAETFHSPV
jgi:hypothetical protein